MKNFKIIENIVIRNYTENISQLMTDESNIFPAGCITIDMFGKSFYQNKQLRYSLRSLLD